MIKKIIKFFNEHIIIRIIIDIILIFIFGNIVTTDIIHKRIFIAIIDIIFLILSIAFLRFNLKKVLKK